MNKNFLKKHLTTLLAIAGSALVATSALAQSSVTYVQGDFLLGFRATGSPGNGSNVLVDIGSSFLTSSTPVTFTLSNLDSTLIGEFGSNWNTRSDVLFSVAGATGSTFANTIVYVTAPESVPGSESSPWPNPGGSVLNGIRGKINSEGGIPNTAGYNFYIGNTNPFGAGPAVIEGNSDTNSYGSFQPGGANAGPAPGASYAQFSPTIEGTFANGTAGITLDLYKLTGSSAAVDLGDFTINDAGVVVWTPQAFEVPEPSTYAMLGLGSLGLVGLTILRRARAAKA